MADKSSGTPTDRSVVETTAERWLIYPSTRKDENSKATLRLLSESAYAIIKASDLDDTPADELLARVSKRFSASLSPYPHDGHVERQWGHTGSYVYKRAADIATTCGIPRGDRFRSARALVLLASYFRFLPYLDGFSRALDAGYSTARVDLISAGHLLARWCIEVEPSMSLLVARALSTGSPEDRMSGTGATAYVYPPFVALFEQALGPHALPGVRGEIATRLARLVPDEIELVLTKQAHASALADSLVRCAREFGIVPELGAGRHQVFGDDRERIARIEATLIELAIGVELELFTTDELATYRPIVGFVASQLDANR